MEQTVYYGLIAVMIVFGLHAGNHWARSMGQAVLLGLAGSAVAIAAFVCLIAVLTIVSPDDFDSTARGERLGALLLFGSAVGPVSAVGGRRRAEKAARLF
jgi:hypothetical protein